MGVVALPELPAIAIVSPAKRLRTGLKKAIDDRNVGKNYKSSLSER